jgi:putative heme-binding domain-containing protein
MLAGIIKTETPSDLTLVASQGLVETVPRTQIRQIRASNLSLMPEGFELTITPQGFADLIAYLKPPSSTSVPVQDD